MAVTHRSKEALADNYNKKKLALQLLSILVFFSIFFFLLLKTFLHIRSLLDGVLFFASVFLAMTAADFAGGLVHWGLDTWGTVETPLIGANAIRNFRVHHVDQKEITRHSFLRTAGSTGIFTIPLLLGAYFISPATHLGFFFISFLSQVAFWTMMTNPIHKWAHVDLDKVPPIPRLFQRMHLFLEPSPHHIHHTEPFTQSYCITTGWCNSILTKTQFFRRLEKLITKITGALPRVDDIGLDAAQKIFLEEQGV